MAFEAEVFADTFITDLRANLVADSITNENFFDGESARSVQVYKDDDSTGANELNADNTVQAQSIGSVLETLSLDQEKDLSILVPQVEEAQSMVGLQEYFQDKQLHNAMREVDDYVLGLHTEANNDIDLDPSASEPTPEEMHRAIRDAKISMDNNDVPRSGRWMVLDPYYSDLIKQEVAQIGQTEEPLLDGAIDRIETFDIFPSTRLKTGDFATNDAEAEVANMFGHQIAITLAMNPDENGFELVGNGEQGTYHGDLLKALLVFGAETMEGDALGRLTAPDPATF